MPELPEVEVTCQGIAPVLVGRRLVGADFRCAMLRYPLPHEYRELMLGQGLHDIRRRGKYLLMRFDTGHLLVHLGMSGSLRLVGPGDPPALHDHVDLVFSPGRHDRGVTVLRMRDPRRFGAVIWIPGDEASANQHPLIAILGIEPLESGFTPQWLKESLHGIKSPIKPALMDGHRVVGIGNIYASESLFRARIDPPTPAGKISLARLERLVPQIRATLHQAIGAGGSSLRDFVRSDGSSGYFQQEYFAYGRTGQPCRQCGTPIREIRQSNRASFYCRCCQR